MKRHILWALVAALVLALAGGAAASNGKASGRSSGHAAPKSRIAHPPLPAALVRALTRKHGKARKTGAVAAKSTPRRAGTRAVPHAAAAPAGDVAGAIASSSVTVGAASYVTVPTNGTPDIATSDSSPGFPMDGEGFAILTNGDATSAFDENSSGGTGTDDSCTPGAGCGSDGDPTTKGATRKNAHDVTILKIPITVATSGAGSGNCLSFDFRYLSEEYPEFVSSPYNDGFIAELDKNTWTANGTNPAATISAPANFASDASTGKPVSTNTASFLQMTSGAASGTTYDGATPILRASTPITAGSHNLYLSIFDQGDHFYDSAAFVDDLRLTTVAAGRCVTGAVVDEPPADLSVLTKVSASGSTADYLVTVHNDGPATALYPRIDDQLFYGLQYTGADGADCSGSDTEAMCSLDAIPGGGTVQFTIHATILDGYGEFASYTTVTSEAFDPVQGNNASFTDDGGTPAFSTANMAVSATTAGAQQGEVVKIPVTISNAGETGDYSDGWYLATYVPKSISFIGYDLPDAEPTPDGFQGCFATYEGDISCSQDAGTTMEPGSSFTIDLYGYVLRSGWITTETDLYTNSAEPTYTDNYSYASFAASPSAFQSSNVAVTETPSGDFAPALGTLSYTIKVTNNGPAEAADVEVTDDQPFDTTGQSVSDTLAGCTELTGSGGVDCHLDLKSGQTDTLTYTVKVNDVEDGSFIENDVSAIPTAYLDPSLDDNYWSAFTVVAPTGPEFADLSAKVSNSPATVTAGTPITTTASITNKGPSAVQDGIIGIFASSFFGGYIASAPEGCAWDDYGDYYCDVGAVAKGQTKSVKIVWVPNGYDQGPLYADVFSEDLTWEDKSFANNEAFAKLVVNQPVADLGIAITDAVDPVVQGGTETYTITVTNAGYDSATGVQVYDVSSGAETFLTASGKNWSCSVQGTITCTLKGTLAPGVSSTITVTATVTDANPVVDSASVSSTSFDPDGSDNTASVLTSISGI